MSRVTRLFLPLLVLLMISGCTDEIEIVSRTLTNTGVYTNDELGFTCHMPVSFGVRTGETTEGTDQIRYVMFGPRDGAQEGPVITVRITDVPNPDSPASKSVNASTMRTYIEESLKADPNVRFVVAPRESTLSGQPAVEAVIDNSAKGGRMYFATMKTYDKYFQVQGNAPIGDDAKLSEVFRLFKDSFRLK